MQSNLRYLVASDSVGMSNNYKPTAEYLAKPGKYQ